MQLNLFESVNSVSWRDPLNYFKNRDNYDKNSPIVVSYGGGKNSTAMLIAMVYKKIKPDLILFADTGAELPETYQWIKTFSDWLQSQDFPGIVTVKRERAKFIKSRKSVINKWFVNYRNFDWFVLSIFLGILSNGNALYSYTDLYEKCILLKTLPSRTFNRGECSVSWKIQPQDRFISKYYQDIIGTIKIRKFIGYHAGEIFRLVNKSSNPFDDDIYRYEYPLIEWGLYQHHCESLIASLGVGLPPKSSCFFCPNRKKYEVEELKRSHPDLYEAACFMEENFTPRDGGYVGLGRRWRWSDLDKLTPLESALIDASQENRRCSCVD